MTLSTRLFEGYAAKDLSHLSGVCLTDMAIRDNRSFVVLSVMEIAMSAMIERELNRAIIRVATKLWMPLLKTSKA